MAKNKCDMVLESDYFSVTPVQVYLDSRLDGYTKAIYGVMRSFGPESRASIKSICERSGFSKTRVLQSIKILIKTNWIYIKKEAIPKEHKPVEYHINSYPSTSGALGSPLKGWGGSPPDKPDLVRQAHHPSTSGAPETDNISREDKQITYSNILIGSGKKSSPDGEHQKCVDAYFLAYKNKFKEEPLCLPADFRALRLLREAGATSEQFTSRLKNLFQDPWAAKQGYTLGHFCRNFQSFAEEAVNASRKKRGENTSGMYDEDNF